MDLYTEIFKDPLVALSLIGGLVVLGILVMQRHVGHSFQRVQSQHGDLPSSCRLSGMAAAERLLVASGLEHIPVKRGAVINHYHPARREIRLTGATCDNTSLAALATAAHEVGHAQHFAEGIWRCRLRKILWPVCWSLVPLVCLYGLAMALGLVPFSLNTLSAGFLLACLLVVVFQAPISLPLESDASRRAREMVTRHGMLAAHERPAFDRLLRAAWKTHAWDEAKRWLVLIALGGGLMLVSSTSIWDEPRDDSAVHRVDYDAPSDDQSIPHDNVMPDVTALFDDLLGLILVVVVAVWIARYMNVFERKHREPTAAEQAVLVNNEAMKLLESGRLREAVDSLSESLELNSQASAVWYNRGHAKLLLGDFRAAISDFNQTIELEPGFMQALAGRGKARFALGEFAPACEDARLVKAADPQNEMALQTLSDEYVRSENFADALELWTAAIRNSPSCGSFYRNRGMVHFTKEDYLAATTDFDDAIRLQPTDAIAWNNRGAARIRLGDYQAAVDDLDKALQLAPGFPNPHRHLAWIQATCPQPDFRDGNMAVTNATHAMESINWQACEWLEVLAAACAEAGDFDSAQRWQQSFVNALHADKDRLPEQRFNQALQSSSDRLQLFQDGLPLRDEPVMS